MKDTQYSYIDTFNLQSPICDYPGVVRELVEEMNEGYLLNESFLKPSGYIDKIESLKLVVQDNETLSLHIKASEPLPPYIFTIMETFIHLSLSQSIATLGHKE